MPVLRNPKHEKFAQLVASGMTAQAAFTHAGYPSPQNAPRLRSNELVAKRIEELQVRNERKAEMAALSRDELVEILAEIVHAARARLSEARLADGLKAAEMLAKLAGYNEPEKHAHQHIEVKVDAALIEQLRAGYVQLGERQAKACLLGQGAGRGGEGPAGGYASQEEAHLGTRSSTTATTNRLPKSLSNRMASGGDSGVVLALPSCAVPTPSHLSQPEGVLRIRFFYGDPRFCLASFLREKETSRGFDEN
jgi:hypothetical protein